ncbi:MAG: helix-turn-helix transcriptional regulator [Gemmatimonadales bacterium]
MTTAQGSLSGHRGLRSQVLLEIKKSQPITTKDLGARFGVSPNAVRRHLKELEADGLVHFVRQQQDVGAPAFAYALTEQGEALFPNGYRDALTEFLGQVAQRDGREAVVAMFEDRYTALTRRLRGELDLAPREERLTVVARVLTEAGYMAEWSEADGTFRLAEHNCAMRAVVDRFPEICAAEERFLKDVLNAEVERQAHIVRGCNSCEYAISFGAAGAGRMQV